MTNQPLPTCAGGLWEQYVGGQQRMASEMKQLRHQGKSRGVPEGLPVATERRAVNLLNAEGGAQLNTAVREDVQGVWNHEL